tara:strand:+ start:714 stop:938 length:225 start_codon:yes stop_codon:yes gene_type:complete
MTFPREIWVAETESGFTHLDLREVCAITEHTIADIDGRCLDTVSIHMKSGTIFTLASDSSSASLIDLWLEVMNQ